MPEDEVTLGEISRQLTDIKADLRRALDDHEQRLRKVERWVYAVPPTLVLAGASILAAIFNG